jgi:hypothetical protein
MKNNKTVSELVLENKALLFQIDQLQELISNLETVVANQQEALGEYESRNEIGNQYDPDTMEY